MSCLLSWKKKDGDRGSSAASKCSTEMKPINMSTERPSGIHVCHFYSSVLRHSARVFPDRSHHPAGSLYFFFNAGPISVSFGRLQLEN